MNKLRQDYKYNIFLVVYDVRLGPIRLMDKKKNVKSYDLVFVVTYNSIDDAL